MQRTCLESSRTPVLRNDYANQNCSIAGTLELIGERWTLLILRDAFLGVRRFDDFQRNLGIARNVLQARLQRLVDNGILRRERYQERPERFEYRLTRKGLDLWPILVSLMSWGDRHLAENGPPTVLVHKGCGGHVDDRRRCDRCGAELDAWDVEPHLGPGADPTQALPGARIGA
jgi:DNA-binding HxlR family transcriptional regulator